MVWYGIEDGREISVWKMPEWNGMEDNLLYFHTNSILDFAPHLVTNIYG